MEKKEEEQEEEEEKEEQENAVEEGWRQNKQVAYAKKCES